MTTRSDLLEKVYASYKTLSEAAQQPPVPFEKMCSAMDYGVAELMKIRAKGPQEPYICIRLDKEFVVYLEINKDRLVANVWTNEQCNFLLGGRNGIARDNNQGRPSPCRTDHGQ